MTELQITAEGPISSVAIDGDVVYREWGDDILLVVRDPTESIDYRAVVAAEPSRADPGDPTNVGDPNDEITDLGDGRWEIDGRAGWESERGVVYGDAFAWTFTGPGTGLLSWEANLPSEEYALTINGTPVTPSAAVQGGFGGGGYGY